MKLIVKIREKLIEETVTIEAAQRSSKVERVIDFVTHLEETKRLKGKKDGESYLLDPEGILRIYIENRQVVAETKTGPYLLGLRLYQTLEQLPEQFIQISQSEIINLKAVKAFKITPNGLVEVTLTNGQITYSSRRYLKSIKEKLL